VAVLTLGNNNVITFLKFFIFIFGGTGFKLRTSYLQSRFFASWATPAVCFALVILETQSLKNCLPGWSQSVILPISASQVASIIGVESPVLGTFLKFEHNFFLWYWGLDSGSLCSTTWATPSGFFALVVFEIGSPLCPSLPGPLSSYLCLLVTGMTGTHSAFIGWDGGPLNFLAMVTSFLDPPIFCLPSS
jgi:hypothetical protein